MKKFKKIFAVLLTLAMVLGMSMTSFAAANDTATITIKGLAADDATTLNVYKFISLDANGNDWVIEEWAQPYVEVEGREYIITDEDELAKAVKDVSPTQVTWTATGTTYTSSEVGIGAYLILASGNKATYTPMIADVAEYGNDGLITAKTVTITAKTSNYTVDKSANDKFVAKGQQVTFTITTTFPSFQVPNSSDNAYTIVDTPTGLGDLTLSSVKIGGTAVTGKTLTANNDGSYTLDLSDQIGNANANAGKTVEVIYTATVTSDDGYENTANAFRGEEELGSDDEKGYTGSIAVKKVDSDDHSVVLNGAEFEVMKGSDKLWFIKLSDGVYKLAKEGESENNNTATQTVVATNGTVQVKGLDEGTYKFVETKAPEGYSVVSTGIEVTITADESKNVDLSGDANLEYANTKLTSLPGTGGIGTTIFTIGGCAIMIIAAALFFASRRKSAK